MEKLYYFGAVDGSTWWSETDPYTSVLIPSYAGTLNREAVLSGDFEPHWKVNPKHVVWVSESE